MSIILITLTWPDSGVWIFIAWARSTTAGTKKLSSRHVEGRDQFILAKSTEWTDYRKRIRGICDAIKAGRAEDEELEALTIQQVEKIAPVKLAPLPHALA
eukprot:5723724-Karenia_brevis.AAC.1